MVLEGLIVEIASRLSCTKPIPWIDLQEAINQFSYIHVLLLNVRWDVHLTDLNLAVNFDLRVGVEGCLSEKHLVNNDAQGP